MVTTIRAAISVVLLAGFYVFAFGIAGGLCWLAVWLFREHPGAAAGKVGLLGVVVAVGIVSALWKVARAKPERTYGVPLTPEQAPELWHTVREIAAQVGTRAPDEIRLAPEVNASVSEDATLLGLRGGRRYLHLGVPLLQAFTVDQLRAVLAHELGHYSHSHTRLGELTYRGQATIEHTIIEVGPGSATGRLLRLYYRLYLLASLAVRRRQELEADRASVRVAGRTAAASALRELEPLDRAWTFYLNNYVAWGLDCGYAPQGIVNGFADLLRARQDELAELRAEARDERASRWDSHPPTAYRVALIEREPDVAVQPDTRPAWTLVPGIAAVADQVEADAFDFGQRTRVPFAEYTTRASAAGHQRDADVLYRAAGRLTGRTPAGLGDVLQLVATGRRNDLITELLRPGPAADQAEIESAFTAVLTAAVSAAAVTSGRAHWRHSWSEPVALVDPDGQPFPLEPAVEAIRAGHVERAREWLGSAGIAEQAAVAQTVQATADWADVEGAVSDIKVGESRCGVIIADTGMILVPVIGKSGDGKARLYHLVRSASPKELATAPGHHWLPYEDVVSARLVRRLPFRFELTMRDGRIIQLKQTSDVEEIDDGLAHLGAAIGRFSS